MQERKIFSKEYPPDIHPFLHYEAIELFSFERNSKVFSYKVYLLITLLVKKKSNKYKTNKGNSSILFNRTNCSSIKMKKKKLSKTIRFLTNCQTFSLFFYSVFSTFARRQVLQTFFFV